MKIGLIKEGKVPCDERVLFTPFQCKELMVKYPKVKIVVQRSTIRRIKDKEYAKHGIELVDSVDDCDLLLGIKEVPVDQLVPKKTYFFFSHTTKKQKHNRELLRTLLAKNISLIDYECLLSGSGCRLLGFGRYAGIVGCYNTLYAYGQRTGSYDLKRAYKCADRSEMEAELGKVKLPANYKIVMTGEGRVANGVLEILEKLAIKRVDIEDFVYETFDEPVFAQLTYCYYNKRKDGEEFSLREFFSEPTQFESNFMIYARVADMYISCHTWHPKSPFIFTRSDAKRSDFKIKIVGDISCDIDGPIASTLRLSSIAQPLYGYDPQLESETDFNAENAITVMSIDNLPCELPRDASEDFGRQFMHKVLPYLLDKHDEECVIHRATVCKNGKLNRLYEYLSDFLYNDLNIIRV